MLIPGLIFAYDDTYDPDASAEVLELAAKLTTDDVRALLAVLAYAAEAEMMRN